MLKRAAFTLIMLFFVFHSIQTVAAIDPIAYYSFDELGNVITDDSGNGRDGTPVGNLELSIVTGDWVHIAVTRNSVTGDAAIYVNGNLEASMQHPNKNPLQTKDEVVIGANVRDVRYYTGLIDEVKFYDAVLSEAEIQRQIAYALDPSDRLTTTWGKIKESD